jgi:hypothetical protein
MHGDFLDRIEHPRPRRLEQLRDRAVENVKSALPAPTVDVHDESTFRKLAFTYYHDWSTDDPEFVMMSEDPGRIGSRHRSDVVEFAELPDDDPLAQISLYRNFAARWLASDNHRFSKTFFGTCADEGLIDIDRSVRQYITSEQFYDDFYLTDANKYRASASSSATRAALSAAFTATELEALAPALIFAFGNDAFDVLNEELDLTPVDGGPDPNSGITTVDGHLYASGRLIDTHVVPLLHMSGQAFGAQRSPDEYAERLRHGLQAWGRHS